MERFLYVVALIFLIIWAIGFFFYSLGSLVHLLLLLAVIVLVIKLSAGRRRRNNRDNSNYRTRN